MKSEKKLNRVDEVKPLLVYLNRLTKLVVQLGLQGSTTSRYLLNLVSWLE